MSLLLGAIADDFTGATDLANTLVGQGMRVVQTIGVPAAELELGNADAIVVALKSRTAPVDESVAVALAALDWLRIRAARQVFFKYCSTFDSTASGNIGPVADALLDALDAGLAVVCPAFPANRRTVYQGHLFVGDQLLSDSPMKDHPLTPMREASLVRLMAAQSRKRVGLVPHTTVAAGVEATRAAFAQLRADGIAYAVVDALTDPDLLTIGAAAVDHRLVTGGSGVALGLPLNFPQAGLLQAAAAPIVPAARGRALVLAGSCSAATRAQIDRAKRVWPTLKLDPHRIAAGERVVDDAVAWASRQDEAAPILIYGSADPAEVAAVQAAYGRERAGAMIEDALGRIASELVGQGARRLIVAGGETAGAVVGALGVQALRIGIEIAPGVPWTETVDERRLALALKSGNFGGEDFFADAFARLPSVPGTAAGSPRA